MVVPSNSSIRTTRRHSHSIYTPESPSQNTRAAKKRRLSQELCRKQQKQELVAVVPSTEIMTPSVLSTEMEDVRYHLPPQLPPIEGLEFEGTHIHSLGAPLSLSTSFSHDGKAMSVDSGIFPQTPTTVVASQIETHGTTLLDVTMADDAVSLVSGVSLTEATAVVMCDGDYRLCGTLKNELETALRASFARHNESTALNAAKTDSSGFLRFPLEIRRLVYGHVLPTVAGKPFCRRGEELEWIRGSCEVLRVNKQIYEEAMDFMYSNLMVEFDVNYTGIAFNTTQRTGKWEDKPKVLVEDVFDDSGLRLPIQRARSIVINVPDVLSLLEYEPLRAHRARVAENGAIELQPRLGKVVNMLMEHCKDLRYVQVNLRDWDKDVETAFELLEPLKTLMSRVPNVTLYRIGWKCWPWTNFELMKEWQVPVKSRYVHRYSLSWEGDMIKTEMVERASVAKLPDDNEDEEP